MKVKDVTLNISDRNKNYNFQKNKERLRVKSSTHDNKQNCILELLIIMKVNFLWHYFTNHL